MDKSRGFSEDVVGVEAWVMFDTLWIEDEDEYYTGASGIVIGLFASAEAALYWYAEEVVGPEKAAAIRWEISPSNDGQREGFDPQGRQVLALIKEEVRGMPA